MNRSAAVPFAQQDAPGTTRGRRSLSSSVRGAARLRFGDFPPVTRELDRGDRRGRVLGRHWDRPLGSLRTTNAIVRAVEAARLRWGAAGKGRVRVAVSGPSTPPTRALRRSVEVAGLRGRLEGRRIHVDWAGDPDEHPVAVLGCALLTGVDRWWRGGDDRVREAGDAVVAHALGGFGRALDLLSGGVRPGAAARHQFRACCLCGLECR